MDNKIVIAKKMEKSYCTLYTYLSAVREMGKHSFMFVKYVV